MNTENEKDKFSCGDGVKLVGFTSVTKVCNWASVSRSQLYADFDNRHSSVRRPKFFNALRKAMDKKHMIERATMEAAILKMKEKDK